jgi:hypothetical protein
MDTVGDQHRPGAARHGGLPGQPQRPEYAVLDPAQNIFGDLQITLFAGISP